MENAPLLLVNETNAHLKCSSCGRLYTDPVISIQCGHTFCRPCVEDGGSCPVDGAKFDTSQLVVNRLVVNQIEDLLIYCRYGLVLQNDEYVCDPSGCQEKIICGHRLDHESSCLFAPVCCQNGGEKCGKFKKNELNQHLLTCQHVPCDHRNKGCEFTSSQESVKLHAKTCGYRNLQEKGNSDQTSILHSENNLLKSEVQKLNQRVSELEACKLSLSNSLESCVSSLKLLETNYDSLKLTVDQLASSRRYSAGYGSPSVEPRQRSGSSRSSRPNSLSPTSSVRVEKWVMPFTFKCIGTLRGHQGEIFCLATQKSKVYTAGADSIIKVWDLDALAKGCLQTLRGHTGELHCMTVSGGFLYSAGTDNSIRAWDVSTGDEHMCNKSAHDNTIAAMTANDEFLFTSSFSLIKVWEARSLTLKHTISGLNHWVRALVLPGSKDHLYSGSHNTIDIWDATGKFNLVGKVDHNFGSVHSLAITNEYILAGTYNRNVHAFDLTSYKYIELMTGHIGSVTSLMVSPCERFVFSGSADHSIKIWNLENLLPIMSLSRHAGGVNCLGLIGDFLLSGSDDAEIKVYKHFQMQMGFGLS